MARNQSEKVQHLSEVPMFRQLSQAQLRRLAKHVDEVTVDEGKVLAREGSKERELLIVVDGQATVRRNDRKIAQLSVGDVIGEMSLVDDEPRSATVTADSDMTLLVIASREFQPLLEDVPGMAKGIMKAMAKRLRVADSQLVD